MKNIKELEDSGVVSVKRVHGRGNKYFLIGVMDRAAPSTETPSRENSSRKKPTRKTPTTQSEKADYHQSEKADTNLPIESIKEPTKVNTQSASRLPACPVAEIVDLYHQLLPSLPRMVVRTPARDGYIKGRWRQFYDAGDFQDKEGGIEMFRNYFTHVKSSAFLMGQSQPSNGRKAFCADLEWLTKPANFAKIVEGKYHVVR